MRVVVTGPESCGKTTLTIQLGKYFNTHYSLEFARAFLEKTAGSYVEEDLLLIAQGQRLANSHENPKELFFCDTDLLTIKVWSLEKFQHVHPDITKWFWEDLPDLYLLCQPDLPWEPDPLRESPNSRDDLFLQYFRTIQQTRVPFEVISGKSAVRLKSAVGHVKRYMTAFDTT
jgi:nicotinamide riboside kinase